MLERVQGGLIGQALSKYGIIGLYTVVVYGIGRFLRLSVTNIRMRIPYEDLPSTRRLDSFCQVCSPSVAVALCHARMCCLERLWGLFSSEPERESTLTGAFRLTSSYRRTHRFRFPSPGHLHCPRRGRAGSRGGALLDAHQHLQVTLPHVRAHQTNLGSVKPDANQPDQLHVSSPSSFPRFECCSISMAVVSSSDLNKLAREFAVLSAMCIIRKQP